MKFIFFVKNNNFKYLMCQAVYVMQTAQNKIDNVYVFYLFKV